MELVTDLALALEPPERVDALVLAAVELAGRTLVKLWRETAKKLTRSLRPAGIEMGETFSCTL